MDAFIGVDIGGTKAAAGVVDRAGRILDTALRATPRRDASPEVVQAVIADLIGELAARHRIQGVGIAAAGFVDRAAEQVRFAPHVSWRDEPLRERVEAAVGLPVTLSNDAKAALIGEQMYGVAHQRTDVLFVALGTGIGGALLIGGELFVGRNGMAGEFGHMCVVPGGRSCECGRSGCWEQYSSGNALTRYAAKVGSSLTGPTITEAAERGDPIALGAFTEIGHWLGVGLADLVAAFDPELVVIGGGVAAAESLLLGPARRTFEELLVGRDYREAPRIVRAALGPSAGVIGAAAIARRTVTGSPPIGRHQLER